MSLHTHCSHGKPYTDECPECDAIWAKDVTLPHARQLVRQLLKFYSTDSLVGLIFAQDHHIEKLQANLSEPRDMQPRSVREG